MKSPIRIAFAIVPSPGRPPSEPGHEQHEDADDRVRLAERERRVVGDALVQHVPRPQPEVRLERQHDPEREEEQPEDEAHEPHREPATDARMRPVRRRYSPNGLNGRAEVETRTLFVSR